MSFVKKQLNFGGGVNDYHKSMIDIFTVSDDDQVEWVAGFGSFIVHRAARQSLEVHNEVFFVFETFPHVSRIESREVDLAVISF